MILRVFSFTGACRVGFGTGKTPILVIVFRKNTHILPTKFPQIDVLARFGGVKFLTFMTVPVIFQAPRYCVFFSGTKFTTSQHRTSGDAHIVASVAVAFRNESTLRNSSK